MDLVNFAPVEFVGAIEAQRAFERDQRKWLRAWRALERAEGQTPVQLPARREADADIPERRAA